MKILKEVLSCNICEDVLPLSPRPILQLSPTAKILIVGQAPGIKAHESGKPWNDASGIRLREWLTLQETVFYDRSFTAILPLGFCYPGRGKSGDNPPRPECRVRWMDSILADLKEVRLHILVGSYATEHFLGKGDFTEKIKTYALSDAPYVVLPHPSPRNNIWLAKNKWFEDQTLPAIKSKIKSFMS